MTATAKSPAPTLTAKQESAQRHQVLTDVTYRNNRASNYTEIIEKLDQDFCYDDNCRHYWGPPELSLFYGSTLYLQASPSQRLALNHLYWITQYNQTAATEANAILYNNVTEGVFSVIGGYDTLCQELSLETEQEHHHIHAFHSVGYKTRKSLFGIQKLVKSQSKLLVKKVLGKQGMSSKSNDFVLRLSSLDWDKLHEDACRQISFRLSSGKGNFAYSSYLQAIEQSKQSIPVQTTGLLGQVVPSSLSKLITVSFGTSPFSACFFYATRYLANMLLKNYEQRYLQYYRKLAQAKEFIPSPTAISYYHMLDESFHTTTSQLIAQDLYKEFSNPTMYERLLANFMFYRGQQVMLSGLSGVMPATFRNDAPFIAPLYQILRSSIFNLSHEDSLFWLRQSLCHEHEGHHMNLKHHHRLLTTMRQAFQPLSYLWNSNRNLDVMASGADIQKSLAGNARALEAFEERLKTID